MEGFSLARFAFTLHTYRESLLDLRLRKPRPTRFKVNCCKVVASLMYHANATYEQPSLEEIATFLSFLFSSFLFFFSSLTNWGKDTRSKRLQRSIPCAAWLMETPRISVINSRGACFSTPPFEGELFKRGGVLFSTSSFRFWPNETQIKPLQNYDF